MRPISLRSLLCPPVVFPSYFSYTQRAYRADVKRFRSETATTPTKLPYKSARLTVHVQVMLDEEFAKDVGDCGKKGPKRVQNREEQGRHRQDSNLGNF